MMLSRQHYRHVFGLALVCSIWLSCMSMAHAQVQTADAADVPAPAGGDDGLGPRGDRLDWNPAWPKFRTSEWVATGASLVGAVVSRLAPVPSTHWQGGIWFDEAARDVVRAESANGRQLARDASDVGLIIMESWPYFDALVVAAWYRQSPEVAWQQGLITSEVLAVTAGVQSVVAALASRERPYGRECGQELPEDSRDCDSTDRYFSFYSGHTSQAFAGAAVNCMHHAYTPLYGGGAADAWACAAGFGVAAGTALLRMGTDVHYATDVSMGALMGTATGLLVPWLLHYRHGAPTELREQKDYSFTLVPAGLGLAGVVTF